MTPFPSNSPQLGRTQYFFGAVVLILNKIFLSVGFINLICEVTLELNGPLKKIKKIKINFGVQFQEFKGGGFLRSSIKQLD